MTGGVQGRERDKMKELDKNYKAIIEGKFTSGFKSINKTSISEIQKRELLKKSSCMKKQLNRYFEVNDEDKFAYYTDKNGNKMRKQFDLNKVILWINMIYIPLNDYNLFKRD